MSQNLRPIIPSKDTKTSPPRLHVLTRCVRELSTLTAIGAIIFSLWFFLGFTENDKSFLHLINAGALSFGVGGLLYIPALWIAALAHRSLKEDRFPKLLPFLLVLPWLPVAWRFFILGEIWVLFTFYLLLFAGLIIVWMIIIWRTATKL